MRSFTICLFLIFCVSSGYAQSKTALVENPFDVFKKGLSKKQIVKTTDTALNFTKNYPSSDFHFINLINPSNKVILRKLPDNLVVQNFGAVCKIELKMQKQIKFPLYIRMGNKDYVDKMEGKGVVNSNKL